MKTLTHLMLPSLVGVAAIALGLLLGSQPMETMPWKAERQDVFSIFLGDARLAFSQAMSHKADSYFHGGVDIEWHEHHHHSHEGQEEDNHTETAEQIGSDEASRERMATEAFETHGDPWAWINARIHSQEHHHLEAERARELLPWYWAACRADPHAIEAYQSSAYVLSSLMHDPAHALAVLDEGIRLNPKSADLEFDKGQILDAVLKNRPAAEKAFHQVLAKSADADNDEHRRLRVRALFYLSVYAHDRGDLATVRANYDAARALLPSYTSTASIGQLLKK